MNTSNKKDNVMSFAQLSGLFGREMIMYSIMRVLMVV